MDMKDIYIQAEEDYLAELAEECQVATDIANNLIASDDVHELIKQLDYVLKLCKEADPVGSRATDALGDIADAVYEQAKSRFDP